MAFTGLKKKQVYNVSEDSLYEDQYKAWRHNMDKNRLDGKFFILYKNFEDHLKHISPGALKLYLYYGFHAKNDTGKSFHSVERCSEYFNVSEKTINNWNKELINRGLIFRKNMPGKLNKNTYLLPFSTNLMKLEKEKIKKFLSHPSFNEAYGQPIKALHLFQFRRDTKPDSKDYNVPYNTLFVVYKNVYKPITSTKPDEEIMHNTIIEFKLENEVYKDIKFSQEIIKGDINLFETPIKFEEHVQNLNIDVQGIMVNPSINIDTTYDPNINTVYMLINDLISDDIDLESYGTTALL